MVKWKIIIQIFFLEYILANIDLKINTAKAIKKERLTRLAFWEQIPNSLGDGNTLIMWNLKPSHSHNIMYLQRRDSILRKSNSELPICYSIKYCEQRYTSIHRKKESDPASSRGVLSMWPTFLIVNLGAQIIDDFKRIILNFAWNIHL